MRTKTLLVAGAALALSLATSQAQVYSQNVVGYVNVTIPGNKQALVGGTLETGLGSNSVNAVLSIGLISYSPTPGDQTTMQIWNTNTLVFDLFYWYDATDASPLPAGWYSGGGSPCTSLLDPANAAYVQNNAAGQITVTIIGNVLEGSHTYIVSVGQNFYGVPDPFAGLPLDDPQINFPATSSADTYQLWTASGGYGGLLYYYNAADASPYPAGWYDGSGTLQSTNPAVWPQPGQGYLINHGGGTSNWLVTYTVARP
jgi:hypothetical protein